MKMVQEHGFFKASEQFENLKETVYQAAKEGRHIHEIEENIFRSILKIGHSLLQEYIDLQGPGDLGPTLDYEDRKLKRLDSTYEKRYVSIFGEIKITRTVYGTREKQKHEIVPLDARINLPDSDFSYLLQDWLQSFCVQESYAKSLKIIERIFDISSSVRSLEQMSNTMAKDIEVFRSEQPRPSATDEQSIIVLTADGKGVPMRREETAEKSQQQGRRKKGEKANKKRMACVGAAYSIESFPRTAEDIMNEISRQEQKEKRPSPIRKQMRAELTREIQGEEKNGKDLIFSWFEKELEYRNPSKDKAIVFIMDGERALWKKREAYDINAVCILDIYHVLERIWSATYCFNSEGTEEAELFVTKRLTKVLQGQAGRVIGGLKQMMVKHQLKGEKKKQLNTVITYLQNNKKYMQYDYYLDKGYPIGSGVIEGACRHLVKDRMELTGMRWKTEGAQSVLDLRAVYLNDEWEKFQKSRCTKNLNKLYPYKALVHEEWLKAA